jgi:hypothetical protein
MATEPTGEQLNALTALVKHHKTAETVMTALAKHHKTAETVMTALAKHHKTAETVMIHARTAAEQSTNRRMKEEQNLLERVRLTRRYEKNQAERKARQSSLRLQEQVLYQKRKEAIKKHSAEKRAEHVKALDSIPPFSLGPSLSTDTLFPFERAELRYLKRCREEKHSSNTN